MKAFITGVTGFIGAHTARACLNAGWEVAAMVRPGSDRSRIAAIESRLRLAEGDLGDFDAALASLSDFRPDVCLHHAWYAEPGKYPHAIENLESLNGTLRLVTKLPDIGCTRFVGIGTCFEYDFDKGWMREDTATKPASLYAATKNACAIALPKVAEKVGVAPTWVRLFYQYGPFEDHRRLVASVIGSLMRGESVDTTEGGQVRDFLHVQDVGNAIQAIAEAGLEGIVNVGSGAPVTVRQIVETIGTELDRLELVNFGARPYNPTDPPFVVANNGRLKAETTWKQRYALHEGLAASIEWWKSR